MIITEKHQHILDKAEELFAGNGFEGTTVRDIATAAEVNLAMISYYFGSKEKLMEALFKHRMDGTRMTIEAVVVNQTITPFQKLEILIDQYINRVFDKQAFYKVMHTEQMLNKNSVIIKVMKQYKIGFINMIDSVIKEGNKTAIFKKEADTMLLLQTMTGTVIQTVLNKDYYKEFHQLGKMKEKEFDVLLKEKLSTYIKNLFKATLGYE
ncbi:TetR/AcrR family transcriptional regulator [Ferruginibacter sp. HRS2-29]|uniref:TetR/AcrR family transcriptional regulator n=1 Tax=Ferruginibacter sp. HRS2-29 TaxID=2487334 RepID=UPI0020CF433E|nr:TetR family transcriptional regulator [Ferruginibacter sp. HRS2-29]